MGKVVILDVAQRELDVFFEVCVVDDENGNCRHELNWNAEEYLHSFKFKKDNFNFTGDLGDEFNRIIIDRDKWGIRSFLRFHDVEEEQIQEAFEWFTKKSNIAKKIDSIITMEKTKINTGDTVELWNREKGEVVGFELATYKIEIGSPSGTTNKVHVMNVRYLNGVEVDAEKLIL